MMWIHMNEDDYNIFGFKNTGNMPKVASFTTPLVLVLFILAPLYLINSNNLLFSTHVLPTQLCINNAFSHKKLCITCATLNPS